MHITLPLSGDYVHSRLPDEPCEDLENHSHLLRLNSDNHKTATLSAFLVTADIADQSDRCLLQLLGAHMKMLQAMVARPLDMPTSIDDIRGAARTLAASAGGKGGSLLQGSPACALVVAHLARRLWADGPAARSSTAPDVLSAVRGLLRHAVPALHPEEQRALAADAFRVMQVRHPCGGGASIAQNRWPNDDRCIFPTWHASQSKQASLAEHVMTQSAGLLGVQHVQCEAVHARHC